MSISRGVVVTVCYFFKCCVNNVEPNIQKSDVIQTFDSGCTSVLQKQIVMFVCL